MLGDRLEMSQEFISGSRSHDSVRLEAGLMIA